MKTTYEQAKLCLDTNYYGVKNVTEALLPLLQNSPSPRIVNVSSRRGALNVRKTIILVVSEHVIILVDFLFSHSECQTRRGERSSEILKT